MSKSTPKKYTQKQIEAAWAAYKGTWCFRYSQEGKAFISTNKPEVGEKAVTGLERVRYFQVMGFPRFLRTVYA